MAGTPRVVVVTRATEYEALLAHHGTAAQARFFLSTRGQTLEEVEAKHARLQDALAAVSKAIPVKWRRTRVDRVDLSRFVFEPQDLVCAVGQDGLVANVAKYLAGQPVLGVDPDPSRNAGVLCRIAAPDVAAVLAKVEAKRATVEERWMVEAALDDGQKLLALNEIFLGHRSHQSARYRLRFGEREEPQSSSGVIVATGTGATGWASSLHRRRVNAAALPSPTARALSFFVREAWESKATFAGLTDGQLEGEDRLSFRSEMDDGGVAFGDGIEDDRLELPWGSTLSVGLSERPLSLVVG